MNCACWPIANCPKAFVLLGTSVAVNFAIGTILTSARLDGWQRTALLTVGMLYNFGMLIVFKYTNAVLQLVEGSDYAPLVAGAIPAGISFYTFHEAVFLLDCYNRKPETIGFLQASPADSPSGRVGSLFQSLVSYASFVVFFPQLVIGPISYLKEMAPQFTAKRFGKINRLDLEVGLTLLAIGLFKKLVIADNIATFVNPLFYSWQAGNSLSPLSAWVAALGARASISRTNCCGPSPRASANAALRWT